MSKRGYRAWTPGEEAKLPCWVAQHSNLTWEERAHQYSVTCKPRSGEAIRSKLQNLRKGIKRHRPLNKRGSNLRSNTAKTAKTARKQRRRETPSLSVCLPHMHSEQEGDEAPGQAAPVLRSQQESYASPQHCAEDRLSQYKQTTMARYVGQQKHHSSWSYGKTFAIYVRRAILTVHPGIGVKGLGWHLSSFQASPRKMALLWKLVYRIAGRIQQ